ncbi:hypothetical protein FHR92_005103 [Fontibacillus solani]|uniref:Uncharacterized protein n=1 Tax=Fontibacillus solani TaxID=1572857 RepID=A0A7W3SYH6_9BACL|nr:hypothetical protein [Fontibacillus solani]MBA9088586.1 hypothetical protein [Fontibacillus solani]
MYDNILKIRISRMKEGERGMKSFGKAIAFLAIILLAGVVLYFSVTG